MVNNQSGNSPSPVADEAEDDSAIAGNQPANDTSNEVNDADGDAGNSQQANQDDKTAGSSDAGEDKSDAKKEPERKLLDVVKDAVEKTGKAKEDSSTSNAENKGTEKKADSKKGEGDDDKPPFHNHPRWKEMVQRNQELEGDAGQYRKVDEFMKKNSLSPGEVVEGLKIMALMRKAPERALAELEKHSASIRLHLGLSLSSDLQEQVDSGAITEEKAKELQLTRNKAAQTEDELKEERAARQSEQLQNLKGNIRTATIEWASAKAKGDPDFSVKQPLVMDRVRAIVAERGKPLISVEDAQAVAEQAYADVTKNLKGIVGKNRRNEVRNMPSGGNTSVSTKPKSLGDAIREAAAL